MLPGCQLPPALPPSVKPQCQLLSFSTLALICRKNEAPECLLHLKGNSLPPVAWAAGKLSTPQVPLSADPGLWAALGALFNAPSQGLSASQWCNKEQTLQHFFFLFLGFCGGRVWVFLVGCFFFFFLATLHSLPIKQELNKKAVIVLQAINLRAITYAFGMCWQGIICNEKLLANQRCESPLALAVPRSGCDSFS